MKTKILFSILTSLFFLVPGIASAKVYKCVGTNGSVTFSGTPGKGCTLFNPSNASVSIVSSPSPSPQSAPSGNAGEIQTNTDSQEVADAQARYDAALKALEEGQAVRYGNEKNYTKYQERIQGLQNSVNEARQALDAARSNTSAPPPPR